MEGLKMTIYSYFFFKVLLFSIFLKYNFITDKINKNVQKLEIQIELITIKFEGTLNLKCIALMELMCV